MKRAPVQNTNKTIIHSEIYFKIFGSVSPSLVGNNAHMLPIFLIFYSDFSHGNYISRKILSKGCGASHGEYKQSAIFKKSFCSRFAIRQFSGEYFLIYHQLPFFP